jgi:hypothetical protein
MNRMSALDMWWVLDASAANGRSPPNSDTSSIRNQVPDGSGVSILLYQADVQPAYYC